MIKVSLVVPVYNVERYLARCLDFCINQTYSNIEIICVNDGSTDRSLDILEHYKKMDDRIVIINKPNGGLSSARNVGMNAASGKYIMFVDSDDFISSVAVEKLLENAEKHNSDFVIFDYLNAQNDSYSRVAITDKSVYEVSVFNIEFLDGYMYSKLPVSAWSKFYNAQFLKENKLFFDEGLIFEDVAFFSKVYTRAKRISYLKEPFYYYTVVRNGNIMSQNGKSLFDVFKVYEIAENELKKSDYYEKYKSCFEINMIFDFIWKFEIIDTEYKEEFFSKIIENHKDIDYTYYNMNALPPRPKRFLETYKIIDETMDYDKFMKKYQEVFNGKNS